MVYFFANISDRQTFQRCNRAASMLFDSATQAPPDGHGSAPVSSRLSDRLHGCTLSFELASEIGNRVCSQESHRLGEPSPRQHLFAADNLVPCRRLLCATSSFLPFCKCERMPPWESAGHRDDRRPAHSVNRGAKKFAECTSAAGEADTKRLRQVHVNGSLRPILNDEFTVSAVFDNRSARTCP